MKIAGLIFTDAIRGTLAISWNYALQPSLQDNTLHEIAVLFDSQIIPHDTGVKRVTMKSFYWNRAHKQSTTFTAEPLVFPRRTFNFHARLKQIKKYNPNGTAAACAGKKFHTDNGTIWPFKRNMQKSPRQPHPLYPPVEVRSR